MREEDKAYIAGMMDGDGSLGLVKRNIGSKNPLYYPSCQFGSVSLAHSVILENNFGGHITTVKGRTGRDGINRNTFYRWQLEKREKTKPFLETILPYLCLKKSQATELLNFIEQNPFIRGSMGLTNEVIFQREKSYLKIRKLNQGRDLNQTVLLPTKKFVEDSTKWAYFAGLMDTDGSFTIKKENPSSGRKNPRYAGQVLLSMNDVRGFNLIGSICPFGNVTLIKAKSCTLGFTFRWALYSFQEIVEVLTRLLPYLRHKKAQAECLIEFFQDRKATKFCRGGISGDELNFRENMRSQMIMLNKHGVLKPSLIDLETQKQGNKAQGESQRKRLNERDVGDDVCESLTTANSLE